MDAQRRQLRKGTAAARMALWSLTTGALILGTAAVAPAQVQLAGDAFPLDDCGGCSRGVPLLAAQADGALYSVWGEPSGTSDSRAFGALFRGGARASATTEFSRAGVQTIVNGIAVSEDGFVVLLEHPGQMYFRAVAPDGSVGPEVPLEEIPDADNDHPSLGARPGTGFAAIWGVGAPGLVQLAARRFTPAGEPLYPIQVLADYSDRSPAAWSWGPRDVCIHADGTVIAVWRTKEDARVDDPAPATLWSRAITPAGGLGPTRAVVVTGALQVNHFFDLVCSDSGVALLVWIDSTSPDRQTLWLQRLDRTGKRLGRAVALKRSYRAASPFSLAAARAPGGDAVIAWGELDGDGEPSVRARRFAANGRARGPESVLLAGDGLNAGQLSLTGHPARPQDLWLGFSRGEAGLWVQALALRSRR